jgi:hypothetical protein
LHIKKHVKDIHMIPSATGFGYWFLNHKKYNKLHVMNNIKIVTLPSIQNFGQRLDTYTVQKKPNTHIQMRMNFSDSLCRMVSTEQMRTSN